MAAFTAAMQNLSIGKSSFAGASIRSAQPAQAARSGAFTIVSKQRKAEVKPNGLPVRIKMHVKKGDTVQVIAGGDKGKTGEVIDVFTKTGKIVVKDCNIKTKHVKARMEGETGQIQRMEAPIHHSNVALFSAEKKVTSRVGHKVNAEGKKVRYLVKTGEFLDDKPAAAESSE